MSQLQNAIALRNEAAQVLARREECLALAIKGELTSLKRELMSLHPTAEYVGDNPEGYPVIWYFYGQLSVFAEVKMCSKYSSPDVNVYTSFQLYDGVEVVNVDDIASVGLAIAKFIIK